MHVLSQEILSITVDRGDKKSFGFSIAVSCHCVHACCICMDINLSSSCMHMHMHAVYTDHPSMQSGDFEGIVIYTVTTNSPADRAGLMQGDTLLSVNNSDTNKLNYEQVSMHSGYILGAVRLLAA